MILYDFISFFILLEILKMKKIIYPNDTNININDYSFFKFENVNSYIYPLNGNQIEIGILCYLEILTYSSK